MDAEQGSLQVISYAPGPGRYTPAQCKAINNQFEVAVKNCSRFAGFATLPMGYPETATHELQRASKKLVFVRALIDSHTNVTYYDRPEYLQFWIMIQQLNISIYLHRTYSSTDLLPQYTGNLPAATSTLSTTTAWGCHEQIGLSFLRLYAAGLSDEQPRLKIIVGHFGELLPCMLERTAMISTSWDNFKRRLETVYSESLWMTTSGDWSLAPPTAILVNTPIEHIIYSVDYPFTSNEAGLAWFRSLEARGMVTEEQVSMIAYQNAQRLLGVTVR